MQTNEKGEILVNVPEVAKAGIKSFSRYNGGWIKTVTALDKTKTNGYSIVGDFVGERSMWVSPGAVFLDCSKEGSRKNQKWTYTVFTIDKAGIGHVTKIPGTETIGQYVMDGPGGDWAVNLWPEIEYVLSQVQKPAMVDKAALEAERANIIARLKEIDGQLGVVDTTQGTLYVLM